jgi:hypothetical protein
MKASNLSAGISSASAFANAARRVSSGMEARPGGAGLAGGDFFAFDRCAAQVSPRLTGGPDDDRGLHEGDWKREVIAVS